MSLAAVERHPDRRATMFANSSPQKEYSTDGSPGQADAGAETETARKRRYNPIYKWQYDPAYTPDPLPLPISETLGTEWSEACERCSFNPAGLPALENAGDDWEAHRARLARLDEELASKRAEFDKALLWLLAVIEHNPVRVRRALGFCEHCECCDV